MTWTIRGLPPTLTDAGGRCLVMGVLNVTPDSFSDGGSWFEPDDAVRHGMALLADGADLLDVGGESTRPGAGRVEPAEEQRRVLPVVRELAAAGAVVSVDTMRAATAAAALDLGAKMINDVSGGLGDPALPPLVADAGVPYVVMHWRGPSADMQSRATYGEVVRDVRDELAARLDAVASSGVHPEQVILDPGLGFAKTAEHNWALLARLDELHELGRPLLVGASRKAFLGRLLAADDGTPCPAAGRDQASAAISAIVAEQGAWCVRVHEVSATRDAVRVAAAITAARRMTVAP